MRSDNVTRSGHQINNVFGVKIGDCFNYRGNIYVVAQFVTFGLGFIYCICVDCENTRHHLNPININQLGIIEI